MIKAILNTLRVAGAPMRTSAIVAAVARQAWAAEVPLPALKKRVRVALEREAAKGLLRRERGTGRSVTWGIA